MMMTDVMREEMVKTHKIPNKNPNEGPIEHTWRTGHVVYFGTKSPWYCKVCEMRAAVYDVLGYRSVNSGERAT